MTRPAKILVVDDEEGFSKSTAAILEEEGYVCHCEPDGAAGLTALAQEDYDLVLCDIRMPHNCGLKSFRIMKDRYPNVPLIVITGYPSVDTAIETLRIRVWDYLVKPIGVDALTECVKDCLARTRTQGSEGGG